jgi:metallo-beta-lactamase family protein
MSVSIAFHGAAGTVTGSCYLVRHPGGAFLVDCGMFQGSKTVKQLNYDRFPFDPREIRFVLLTHAHIDHAGLLPKLVKAGFTGPILATEGSRDLLTFMLPDSGYIQELEVDRLNRRNARRGRDEVEPIYTRADAEACLQRFTTVTYDTWIECGEGVRARYWNAGHILGAASIEVEIATGDRAQRRLRVLFSGDIGPEHKLFHPDPDAPANIDHLVVESTYGDRERKPFTPEARRRALREEVLRTMKRGGNLLIPAFAVERSQELIADLIHLFKADELPRIPVYLDSPLATRATGVFARHARDLEDVTSAASFTAPNIHYVETVEQSMALGRIHGGAIIISASGMCDAGRIRDHLRNNLWRPEATVLLVGYQAPGTLGNLLQTGVRAVRIRGEEVAVRASIRQLDAYSGHADKGGLIAWVKERLPVKGRIFLVHGEDTALDGMKQALVEVGCTADSIVVPKLDDVYRLDAGAGLEPASHRLAPEVVGQLDWHNDYAAFVLALEERLRSLPDDETRRALIAKLHAAMTAPSSAAP